MTKKNKQKKKINLISRMIWLMFIILLIVFMGLVINLNILPAQYFSLLIVAVVILSLILSGILLFPKVKSKIKIIGIIFALLINGVFVFGITKLYSTIDFLNGITDDKYQTENYFVIVRNDSKYSSLEDLNNKKMGIFNSTAGSYKSARKQILSKTNTRNIDYQDNLILGDDLLDRKVDAIFVSEGYRDNMVEEIDAFAANTKIIHTISIKTKSKSIVKKVKVTEESFNIFISGIDTYGKISSVSRSDVNMIVTVNPNTHQILLTSIPRDYYVQLNGTTGRKDKLTHAGMYGVDKSVKTLEDLFQIDINYYAKVNFSTLVKVVDIIGGIDVYSDASFIPWTDRTVRIRKGNMHMNGKTALAFARERHAYREGDRHRVKNQQDVFTAIMNKMLSSETLLRKYDSLLGTLKNSFQTNMDQGDLKSLIRTQIRKMPKWTIISQSVNGTDSSNYTYSYPTQKLYVMEPDMKTVTAATAKIKEVFEAK